MKLTKEHLKPVRNQVWNQVKPEYYREKFEGTPEDLEYVWPTRDEL